MTDRFRWHPEARLFNSAGQEVPQAQSTGAILPNSPHGLAQAFDLPSFRLGAPDCPPPGTHVLAVFETLTSGSTGQPRRILRTQGSWTASFAVNAGFGIGPGARLAVLGGLVFSLALYGAIEGLHLGAEVHLLGGLRPDFQAKALARHRISHLYASPAQLRLLVAAHLPCPDLRLVMVGGSKLDAGLRAAVTAMAPAATVREFYGSAETSFVTLADAATPEASVGRAYPRVEIAVEAGEIRVRSPYLFLGYAGPPGHARWRDGWLSVGERGSLDAGFLVLHGRASRMVTVADQNVFPEAIEALLQSLPGIAQAAVLPVPDAVRGQVLVALVQGDPSCEAAILTALRRKLGPLKAPKALIWQEDWPVLPSGKTNLQALQTRLTWPA